MKLEVKYDTVLARFRSIPEVLSAVIADESGLVVDGFGKEETMEYLAGYGKAVFDSGEMLVKEAIREEIGSEYPCSADMLTIETTGAKVFIKRAKDKTLVVMTNKDFMNIGLMRIKLREASKILEKMTEV